MKLKKLNSPDAKPVQFRSFRFPARKTILSFIRENLDKKFDEKLGKNPERGIEELDIINTIIKGDPLVCGVNTRQPPANDEAFVKIGDNVFLYEGKDINSRGLWISKQAERYDLNSGGMVPYTEWSSYKLNTNATLAINEKYDINPTELLPENFEPKSMVVQEDKRKILKFKANFGGNEREIYAKGSWIIFSFFSEPPSYRLTALAECRKVTSKREMETNLKLTNSGINVPPVVGYYESMFEEFSFVETVAGDNPIRHLQSHRETIIKQDAEMLARLCLLGYHKQGFADFDDKIFNGKDLFLIDTEEIEDLYHLEAIDFRSLLLNPTNEKELGEFRNSQMHIFTGELRDVIFEYRNSLLQSVESRILYAKSFYKALGLKEPTQKEMRKMLSFKLNYMTRDRYVSAMMDAG